MRKNRERAGLLFFRPRGGAANERHAKNRDATRDAELTALLRHWKAPDTSRAMDRRLLAAYQMHAPRVPRWRQMLTARITVPVPVVAATAIIIFGLAVFSVLRGVSAPVISLAAPVVTIEPAAGPVQLVEIPVRREPTSTRRLMPAAGGRRRVGERGRRPILASSGRINSHLAARGVEEDTGYFTRVDMKEFRPADAMRIRVIRKGTEDED